MWLCLAQSGRSLEVPLAWLSAELVIEFEFGAQTEETTRISEGRKRLRLGSESAANELRRSRARGRSRWKWAHLALAQAHSAHPWPPVIHVDINGSRGSRSHFGAKWDLAVSKEQLRCKLIAANGRERESTASRIHLLGWSLARRNWTLKNLSLTTLLKNNTTNQNLSQLSPEEAPNRPIDLSRKANQRLAQKTKANRALERKSKQREEAEKGKWRADGVL